MFVIVFHLALFYFAAWARFHVQPVLQFSLCPYFHQGHDGIVGEVYEGVLDRLLYFGMLLGVQEQVANATYLVAKQTGRIAPPTELYFIGEGIAVVLVLSLVEGGHLLGDLDELAGCTVVHSCGRVIFRC